MSTKAPRRRAAPADCHPASFELIVVDPMTDYAELCQALGGEPFVFDAGLSGGILDPIGLGPYPRETTSAMVR